jgi:predicted DNA-binding transcriptional regulator YafY
MPSADHFTIYSRQWELLKFLPSRQPGMSARQLHEKLITAGHEVGKRTIERDLSELSRIFPIVSNEISIPYGWYWKPGARVDFPGIDLAEAVSLGMMENILRQLVPDTFVEALEGRFAAANEKLKALPKNRHAKWAGLVRYLPPGLPLQKPAIDPDVSRAVQQGLFDGRQLKVIYQGANADCTSERVLHPLAIIQQGERSYLLATTFSFPDVLYYAIHRIQSASILDEPATRPDGFTLDAFLATSGGQFGDGKKIILKACLTDHLATIATIATIATATPTAMDEPCGWQVEVSVSSEPNSRQPAEISFWLYFIDFNTTYDDECPSVLMNSPEFR